MTLKAFLSYTQPAARVWNSISRLFSYIGLFKKPTEASRTSEQGEAAAATGPASRLAKLTQAPINTGDKGRC